MKKYVLFFALTVLTISVWSQAELSSLRIAFYNSDSLNAGYTYLIEQDALLKRHQEAFQEEVAARECDLQIMYNKLVEAEQKMLFTATELQQKTTEFQQQVQKLEVYRQTEGAKLQQEAVDMQTELESRLNEFARKYCEMNHIDLLLMKAPAGQFTYITPKLDVTQSFIDFVNAEQQK